jgi:hypothetical protein
MQTGALITAFLHIAFWNEGMILYFHINISMPDNHGIENYIWFIVID